MTEPAGIRGGETEEGARPRTRDSKQSKNEDVQKDQWGNGDMSAMMNGNNNFNAMNGAFPVDFNQMMANGMQMPGGNFPNVMGEFASVRLLCILANCCQRWVWTQP